MQKFKLLNPFRSAWQKKLGYLVHCRFDKLWKGDEYDLFLIWLKTRAVPAGGFLVKFPMKEGNGWIFYRISEATNMDVTIPLYPDIALPTPGKRDYNCPEEWKNFPVWEVEL